MRMLAAIAGALFPLPALAQTTTPAAARSEAIAALALSGAIVLAIIALGVGHILAWRGRRRAAADRRRIRELFGTLARTTAVLDAAPAGFFEWSALSGLETCSSGLAQSLGASPVAVKTFRDLSPYFTDTDFAVLEVAVDALRAERRPFDRVVRAKNGRVLETCGRVVCAAGPGEPLSVTRWFHDATAFAGDVAVGQAATAAAAAERDRLAQILDLAPFPAWRRGSDLRIAWVNRAYAAAVESDFATIVANAVEFAPGAGPQQSRSLAALARETGVAQTDTRRFNAAGERRVYEITEASLAEGGAMGFARDVTAREEAHAELKRHTQAHAAVMDRLRSAIAIFGPDRKLRFFNEAYFRLWKLDEPWLQTGPSHAEILEVLREARRIPEAADFRAYKSQVMSLYASVLAPEEEVQHLPDGRTLRVITSPHPFGGLMFLYEDVSDRLELERARNTLAEVQRATFDHLFEGVAVFGGDGRLKLYNKRFASLWVLDESFLNSEPHVADVAERCRDLFPHGGASWAVVKDKIVSRALDRSARNARLTRPGGLVVHYASVPLPDGNTLYTYLDISEEPPASVTHRRGAAGAS